VEAGQRVWSIQLLVLDRLRLHVDSLLRSAPATPEADPASDRLWMDIPGPARAEGAGGLEPLRVDRVELGPDDLRAFPHAVRQASRPCALPAVAEAGL
jgi:hypothetical protein